MNKKDTSKNKKKLHDIHASIRFLENLSQEIEVAEKLSDIQDKNILLKFNQVIQIIKKELLGK
ncbi:MAG: hypothetical protein DCC88_08455 [Spirobacillus cienkowskii]|jgi:hypothetical protein|uniref:Phage protein n=1 Tax=Spirobacillus cienkowskii TaxID=495820 RepID=A0A369KX96_9BACT|nr:MAG: hypothetical protein DCC88_08455 [Spirobacillus cienkowskii]